MYAVVYISSPYIHKLYPTRFWFSFLDFSYSQHLRGNVLFRLRRMLLYSIMREINSVHFSSVSVHPSSFSGKCPINIKYFPVSSTLLASPLIPDVHSFPAGIAHDFYVLPASRYHSCIFIDCVMPFIEAPFNVCFVINSNSNIFLSSSIRVRIQHPAWITQRAVCSCERDIGIKTSKCDLIVDLKAPYIIMCYLIFELLTVGLTSRVSPDVTNLPEQVGEAEGLLHGASGEVRVEPRDPRLWSRRSLSAPWPPLWGRSFICSDRIFRARGLGRGFDEEWSGIGFWQGRISLHGRVPPYLLSYGADCKSKPAVGFGCNFFEAIDWQGEESEFRVGKWAVWDPDIV